MLEFTSNLNKKESSNEELGTFLFATILIGVFLLFAYFRGKSDKNNTSSKEEMDKLTAILKKYYPKICQYINTELKDDPFFFEKTHSEMVLVDNCLICVKERIAKFPKLVNMPEPSNSDTINSYNKKLAQYFGNKKFCMEHINEWDSPWSGMPKHMAGNTYKEGNWLNANKVGALFSLVPQCQKYEKLIHTKFVKIYNIRLKDEEDNKYWTIRDSEIMDKYIGSEFFADDDADYSDCWNNGIGYYVDDIIYNMVKHLKSYLVQKYGKDKIKEVISKHNV